MGRSAAGRGAISPADWKDYLMIISELKKHFHKGRANAYAWPGGYPLFYVMSDGGVLCPKCMTKERALVFRSTHERAGDGWALEAADVNYEEPNLLCDHCGKRIESAYAEDEVKEAN